MNNPDPAAGAEEGGEKEMMTAMFASLVLQQTNMASIFLGLAPHPQTGKQERDLEHAKYFIDQLEMLEAKTRGNLDPREAGLLKQSLTSLRLAFVEAVSHPAAPTQGGEPKVETEKASPPAAPAAEPAGAPPKPEADSRPTPPAEDSHKKFTKKY